MSVDQIRSFGNGHFSHLAENFRLENENNLARDSSLFEDTIWKWTDWIVVSNNFLFLHYFNSN